MCKIQNKTIDYYNDLIAVYVTQCPIRSYLSYLALSVIVNCFVLLYLKSAECAMVFVKSSTLTETEYTIDHTFKFQLNLLSDRPTAVV